MHGAVQGQGSSLRESTNYYFFTWNPCSDLSINMFVHNLGRSLQPLYVCLLKYNVVYCTLRALGFNLLQIIQRLNIKPGRHSEAKIQSDGDDGGSGADYLEMVRPDGV